MSISLILVSCLWLFCFSYIFVMLRKEKRLINKIKEIEDEIDLLKFPLG